MSTKFTALEIGKGDAFLLEEPENNWKCLFDAGGSKGTIVSLLRKKKIANINLAICSHNDDDHANGFIGLLRSNIQIDEIWLPGTWASVLKYVKDNGIGPEEAGFLVEVVCKYYGKAPNGSSCQIDDDASNAEVYNDRDLFDSETEEPIEDFDDSLYCISELIDLEYNIMKLHPFLYHYLYHCKHGIGIKYRSLVMAIDRIIKIAGLAYQKGCKIRWFNPVNSCTRNSVDYGFVALNSNEMFCVQKPKNALNFALLCSLTVENEYSLVFEYLKDGIPILRFSADSDCTCQSRSYDEDIRVTAPHHGSEANDVVYNNLMGNKIIWVRSDSKSRKRPCSVFKGLKKKCCLACFNYNFKKEICFEYSNKQWIKIKGNICNC